MAYTLHLSWVEHVLLSGLIFGFYSCCHIDLTLKSEAEDAVVPALSGILLEI